MADATCGHCKEPIRECTRDFPSGHAGGDVTARQCRGWQHHNGWYLCDPDLTHNYSPRRDVAEPQASLEDALRTQEVPHG